MRRRALPAFVVGLLLVGGASRIWAQSLGDVAKKEQERRRNLPSSGKVYTNKDLGSVPPPPPQPSSTAADSNPPDTKPGEKEAAKEDKEADRKGQDEDKDKGKDKDKEKDKDKDQAAEPRGQAYWANRHKTLVETLDRDSTFADALQSRINALTTDYVNRDDPAQRAVIEKDRQKAIAELERMKKQIAEDRKALADLEEEARRAGVPPGWLR